MKISVITVCFNSAATIEQTILSVAAQTHADREYLVIDGASRDATAEIVARHREVITRFVSEPDRGLYDAMNKGIRMASGEVVGILNADDFYAHEHVLARVAQAMADPSVEACYGDLFYVDAHDTERVVRYWRSGPMRPRAIERGWFPPHPTFFVRRSLYERYGLFDLSFGSAADAELMIRLLGKHRVRAAYIPEVLVHMRTGGTSNSGLRQVIRQNLTLYRALAHNGLDYSPFFPLWKLPSRLKQFIERPGGVG